MLVKNGALNEMRPSCTPSPGGPEQRQPEYPQVSGSQLGTDPAKRAAETKGAEDEALERQDLSTVRNIEHHRTIGNRDAGQFGEPRPRIGQPLEGVGRAADVGTIDSDRHLATAVRLAAGRRAAPGSGHAGQSGERWPPSTHRIGEPRARWDARPPWPL